MAKQSKYIEEKKKENHTTSFSESYKIICTPTFLSEARQLSKKYPNIKADFLALKDVLKNNPEQGDNLGHGLRKIRMEISDKAGGKSGGARVIIQVKIIYRTVYVLSTYDKAEYDTVITELLKKHLRKEEEKRQQAEASKRKRR